MQTNTYAPGYSVPVLSFMGQRNAETNAAFFLPYLSPGRELLDAGCGPGTITLGLGRKLAPGRVVGIDIEGSQYARAADEAKREGINVEFRQADVYQLPFPDESFDAVFSHALIEHLGDPVAALTEFHRVLKRGGLLGVRAGDMGGILIDSESSGPAEGLANYLANRGENSGDIHAGRKLGRLLRKAGFDVEKMTASYDVISEMLRKIGSSLADQFEKGSYCSLPKQGGDDSLFVALAWCEAIGRRS